MPSAYPAEFCARAAGLLTIPQAVYGAPDNLLATSQPRAVRRSSRTPTRTSPRTTDWLSRRPSRLPQRGQGVATALALRNHTPPRVCRAHRRRVLPAGHLVRQRLLRSTTMPKRPRPAHNGHACGGRNDVSPSVGKLARPPQLRTNHTTGLLCGHRRHRFGEQTHRVGRLPHSWP